MAGRSLSAEGWDAGLQSPKSIQGRVSRELQSDVTLTSKLGGKCPIGKEDGWAERKQGGRPGSLSYCWRGGSLVQRGGTEETDF